MRFLLSVLFLFLSLSAGSVFGASAQEWSSEGEATAPSKMNLGTSYATLPSENQPQPTLFAAPAPVKSLAPQALPTETLPAQQGDMLEASPLPIIRSETSETLPTQTLAPLQAQYLTPNYRQQLITQNVIQPIVRTQPVLQVRHITQNVYQPTLQKQPVVQKVITQPILHRVLHNQPIIRQQLQQQTVVKRRVIAQPRVVQQLQMMYQTAPQQTQQEFGAAYPTQTIPNAKVAQLMGNAAAAPSFNDAPAAAPDASPDAAADPSMEGGSADEE